MSARTELAAYLADYLPDAWIVIPRDDDPTISKITVMTYVETVAHGRSAFQRTYDLSVLILTPVQKGGDDGLEDALEEVLEAIDLWQPGKAVRWTAAEYAALGQYPAYRVTVEMEVLHVYPEPEPEDLIAPPPEEEE